MVMWELGTRRRQSTCTDVAKAAKRIDTGFFSLFWQIPTIVDCYLWLAAGWWKEQRHFSHCQCQEIASLYYKQELLISWGCRSRIFACCRECTPSFSCSKLHTLASSRSLLDHWTDGKWGAPIASQIIKKLTLVYGKYGGRPTAGNLSCLQSFLPACRCDLRALDAHHSHVLRHLR